MQKTILTTLLSALFLAAFGVAVLLLWPISGPEEQAGEMPAFYSASEPLRSKAGGDDLNSASVRQPQTAVRPIEEGLPQPAQVSGIPGDAPGLPEALRGLSLEAQEEAAREMGREADFSSAMAVFSNPGTPASVSKILFDAALNRSNEVKLPFLAEIADSRNHLLGDEARDLLGLYLNLKPDVVSQGEWGNAVRRYLAKAESP